MTRSIHTRWRSACYVIKTSRCIVFWRLESCILSGRSARYKFSWTASRREKSSSLRRYSTLSIGAPGMAEGSSLSVDLHKSIDLCIHSKGSSCLSRLLIFKMAQPVPAGLSTPEPSRTGLVHLNLLCSF